MHLTSEQLAIINSTGDIKINAVAGSGKTTTIIEYAKARPATSKILYLALNKSVKLEAQKKFADQGLHNVKVETAHSLAFREIVFRSNYRIKANGYKTHEIVDILGLQNTGDKHAEYIAANHINKFIAYFCNSDKQKVQDLNYRDVVFDQEAKAFVASAYAYIEKQTRQFLAKMDKGEIEITHDFYLKKFQLSNPRLYFDYILFDEGQDASPAMLDIFFKQSATKVIVGDTHQQIYGWRFAVNSLEKANFNTYHLSSSFRFSADIAKLAVDVLAWKNFVGEEQQFSIEGKGSGKKDNKVKAIIARTNLGLLLKAIEFVIEKKNVKHIYFEGNIHSYTYADEGTSLYDVLNLYNKKPALIRDKLIAQMKNMEELEEYIEKTEDVQLKMMIEIVEEYGNDIPGILNLIKEKHVGNDEKHKAEMIFSTVHRCKGMEYDSIQIVNDFITQDKIEKQTKGTRTDDEINVAKLNEEINLLYVAVTRTKNLIHIPETLLPKNATPSAQIQVLRVYAEEEGRKATAQQSAKMKAKNQKETIGYPKEKSYSVDEARDKNKDAYKPWTQALDQELARMYLDGISLGDMAKHFDRTRGAIGSRIKKLELEYIYRN